MTRKDFLLIAETIRQLALRPQQSETELRQRVAEQFAKALKTTNPNFNAERFIAACMGEG